MAWLGNKATSQSNRSDEIDAKIYAKADLLQDSSEQQLLSLSLSLRQNTKLHFQICDVSLYNEPTKSV